MSEARQVLSLLAGTLKSQNLVTDEGQAVLDIVSRYAKTWSLLLQYDEDGLAIPEKAQTKVTTLALPEKKTGHHATPFP